MSNVPTLGYWNARGLTEPIRYLLKYAGVQFNDKRYEFGEGSTVQEIDKLRKNWYPDKFNLGLDFPNLPFYIDGDVKVRLYLNVLIPCQFIFTISINI
jgi:glutathione S-transferase